MKNLYINPILLYPIHVSHILSNTLILLTIILLNILLYHRTIFFGLVIDDIDWFRQFPCGLPTLRQCLQITTMPVYKRILHYTQIRFYAANPRRSIRANHITTLSLHILTAVLIAIISPVAAFLYSCHPCNHMTAIWLTGRRYQYLIITTLILTLTHILYLLILVSIPVIYFLYHSQLTRHKRHIPRSPYTLPSIRRGITTSALKLSGIGYTPMFMYPYNLPNQPSSAVSSILPYSQPNSERYLNLILPYTCIAISHIPFSTTLILPYLYQSIRLQPMYRNIQSFYEYHILLSANNPKLALLNKLYREIKPMP